MAHVFISYAREDEDRAQLLARRLTENLTGTDVSVWWDRKIRPGEEWDQVIGTALREAVCVIVLWSENSVTSPFVKEEARRAKRRSALIPVLLADIDPPLGFGDLECAELPDWDGDALHPEYVGLARAVQDRVADAATDAEVDGPSGGDETAQTSAVVEDSAAQADVDVGPVETASELDLAAIELIPNSPLDGILLRPAVEDAPASPDAGAVEEDVSAELATADPDPVPAEEGIPAELAAADPDPVPIGEDVSAELAAADPDPVPVEEGIPAELVAADPDPVPDGDSAEGDVSARLADVDPDPDSAEEDVGAKLPEADVDTEPVESGVRVEETASADPKSEPDANGAVAADGSSADRGGTATGVTTPTSPSDPSRAKKGANARPEPRSRPEPRTRPAVAPMAAAAVVVLLGLMDLAFYGPVSGLMGRERPVEVTTTTDTNGGGIDDSNGAVDGGTDSEEATALAQYALLEQMAGDPSEGLEDVVAFAGAVVEDHGGQLPTGDRRRAERIHGELSEALLLWQTANSLDPGTPIGDQVEVWSRFLDTYTRTDSREYRTALEALEDLEAQATSGIGVHEHEICTTIAELNCANPGTTFNARQTLYFWVRLSVPSAERVTIRWSGEGGGIVGSSSHDVTASSSYRVYGGDAMDTPGRYYVELLNSRGLRLVRQEFTVR